MSTVKQNKGLGKGFDALIPTDFDNSILLDNKDRLQKLNLTDIVPNSDQPRHQFNQIELEELAVSIKRYGILQPLIVSPLKKGNYRIIAGERRWRSAQIAGLKEAPVIIRDQKELEELEISLIENVQRVDLSPLEQAISVERLHQQFNMSYNDIAKRLGKAAPTIINTVRLLQLPEEARGALRDNLITEGHARAILALRGQPLKQSELLRLIQQRTWSVRQAEQFVIATRKGIGTKTVLGRHMARETVETKKLSKSLKIPVKLHHTAHGGYLELHFSTESELQDLYNKLDRL